MRRCFDWLAAFFGIAVGVFVIGLLAHNEKPSGEWTAVVTMVIFGIAPLVASIVALRSRRQAAHLFFVGAVVGAMCVVWTWVLVRAREGAASASLASLLLFLGTTALVFAGPGIFWLLTDRKHWPPLIQHSLTPRLRILLALGISVALLVGMVAIGLYAAAILPEFGDCGEPRPFAAPKSAEHAAFTAQIIYVHQISRYAGWSIARVRQRYWGLPWWNHRFVVLPYRFNLGDSYLVDGYVRPSLVGHLISLMQLHCSRTAPVSDAQIDLRLLRDGPPQKGVRVIGRVLKLQPASESPRVAPHVTVTIIQDGGPRVTTRTDEQGIYDASELPPGHYEARLDSCLISADSYGCSCSEPSEEKVEEGHVWGCTLRILRDPKSK
jgi:hypothetical protein